MVAKETGIHYLIAYPRLRVLLAAVLLFSLVGSTCRKELPPDAPSAPGGPSEGRVSVPYSFATAGSDPKGDSIRYRFDWGDDTLEWTGYYPSESLAQLSHAWSSPGRYGLKVMAQNVRGDSSAWSDSSRIVIADYPYRVVATIPVGKEPAEIAVLPNGQYAYVTDPCYNDTIYKIRTSDNTVVTKIITDTGFPSSAPTGIAALPNGEFVYAACYAGANVTVIRTRDDSIVARIPVPYSARRVAVLPSGEYVYVTSTSYDCVSVIRTSDNTVVKTLPVGFDPVGVAAAPDGRHVYVAIFGLDEVYVIDTPGNSSMRRVGIGGWGACQVAVLPNSQYVYVSNVNQGTGVAVIRASDNALLRCIPVPGGSGDIAALPDGNYVYVASYDSSLVSVIRTSDDSIVARIRVGTGPTCVAAAPGGECVYVVNKDSGTISVIGY